MAFASVGISSNVSSFTHEKRFPLSTTISQLKAKLELITGANCTTMRLELLDGDKKLVCSLNNDEATLEDCGVCTGMNIHVTDSDPSRLKGDFEDVSKVEKFEISNEEYSKRTDSVRAFKERMKLGQFAEKNNEEEIERKRKEEEELAKSITVGKRCLVTVKKDQPKRGVVMFVGQTHFKEGYWVGVKYDEPLGKNDGSVEGKRYFDCPMKYGAFVKPNFVQVGDYPELSLSDDEM